MTDVKSLIAEARRTAKHPSEDRDWQNIVLILADALEAEHQRPKLPTVSAYEYVLAERDRYKAEAESARKTGERILADALRYRAAIQTARDVEESSYLLATGRWPDEHNSTSTLRILTRALNENGETDG